MSWNAPPPYQNQQGYGGQPGGQFGSQPPAQQGGYGAPPRYGSQPMPQQGGYGAPPPQQGGYHAPPPQQGGYHAPPQPQPGGYGAPPPQQAMYGAPAGHGYGAPQRTAAPPPYGGQGGYAPPPPGISPELWGWFQAVDADRSGKITSRELQQALHNGNWTPFNPETCRLMIGMFDRDRNGTIDVNEFAALWKYIQDWKACFDRFDTDRSGTISSDELSNAFRTFGYNLSMNFITVCMKTYDKHMKGSINFDDFIQCCVLLKSLTDKFRVKDAQQSGVIKIQYEEFLRMVLDT